MSNSLNSYLLILKNCATKQVWLNTVQNISTNKLYYEFDFQMPNDCPAGEYNYYLLWDTYDADNVEFIVNNEMLNSVFKFKNGKSITLADALPETGIIKYIKDDTDETLEYEQKTDFLVYE